MNRILKISVLDRTDTEDFEQLKGLLKKFTIDTYIRNKEGFSELKGNKKFELVNNVISEFEGQKKLSILTTNEIEQLNKDIDSQINLAKESIENGKNINTETRYYILKDDDKIISFQQAQLAKKSDRIEGWRNLAYIEQKYAGKKGQVIDSEEVLQNGLYSEIIYEDIGKWFEKSGVNYERTCTGVNMLPNILAYIRAKGFLPFNKNEKNIFLEKFTGQKIDRETLSLAYKLYFKHAQRREHKTKNEILGEMQDRVEFESLTEEQKSGLVQCFLKEDEKEFEIPNDKLQLLNKLISNLIENNNSTVNTYDNEIETFAKLELMKLKEQQGQISNEDIRTMQKKYGITNAQLSSVLGRLAQSEVSKLMETDNRKRDSFAQPELFSKQEIGKATVETTTEKKDIAMSRINKDTQLTINKENKKEGEEI